MVRSLIQGIMTTVEIVNVVASGQLGRELDLHAVSNSQSLQTNEHFYSVELNQKSGERLLIRFEEQGPIGILSRKGVCIITGAKSTNDAHNKTNILLQALADASVIPNPNINDYGIRNMVCTGNIGQTVDLENIAILFGLENTEYEPEQFPGLVYRSPDEPGVTLIFASGKVVFTGVENVETAERMFINIKDEIGDVFRST